MASLAEYLDGVVRVPLRLLSSDGLPECAPALLRQAQVTDFNQFLSNPTNPIAAVITPGRMMDMLGDIGVTLGQLRQTVSSSRNPLLNQTVRLNCLVGAECLQTAKVILGEEFQCLVRLYCVPSGTLCLQLTFGDTANVE